MAGHPGLGYPSGANPQSATENYLWLALPFTSLLEHAAEHGYGVPAFNINNMEQGLTIMTAAAAIDYPVIIQASRGARAYANDIGSPN
jgi:fructose/tagatose bisphosphate aldolase